VCVHVCVLTMLHRVGVRERRGRIVGFSGACGSVVSAYVDACARCSQEFDGPLVGVKAASTLPTKDDSESDENVD
jgi:hypothetical protein